MTRREMLSQERVLSTAMFLFAVAGIAIAAYLTAAHYSGVALACTYNQAVDCGAVTQSPFSTIGATGVPISVLGVAWFALSATLALVTLRTRLRAPTVAHFALSAVALAYVVYLLYAELVVIHRICEWCTAVHVLVFLTFLASLRRLQVTF